MAGRRDPRKRIYPPGTSFSILHLSILVGVLFVGLATVNFYRGGDVLRYAKRLIRPGDYSDAAPAPTVKVLADGSTEYRLMAVTDLDHHSRNADGKSWQSLLIEGVLRVNANRTAAQIDWDTRKQALVSEFAAGGRAMELSDLAYFDGHVLSVDDRTGIVYRIMERKSVVPWVFLNDGPGDTAKGFKAEWMTVKDGQLYVGGLGKEWTTPDGTFVNNNPMYVKKVTRRGEVDHLDWVTNFKALRRAAGIEYPGYMIFESGQWSDIHQRWFFLLRRVSNETYSETRDEFQGSNLMLIADEQFTHVTVREVGEPVSDGLRGFSAFQFLPGSDDSTIVALKSEERGGVAVASFLTVFDVATGRTILGETPIGEEPYKFEGLLFI